MSKFNIAVSPTKPDVINRAGGEAFSESPELALVNLLLTSFCKSKHYESETEERQRLFFILENVDPEFAAKAAVYARNEFGMRSISHLVAAYIPKLASGQKWTRKFFRAVVRRPDDITEILAAYKVINGKLKPIAASMKKGLGDALRDVGEYGMAKYKGTGKEIKLVDVANLFHPLPTHAITSLVNGTLAPADTWETAISATGQEGSETTKTEEWTRLIMEKKLRYFALLRNIRNITAAITDNAVFDEFLIQLCDPEAIKKSLVLPFRFLTAYKAFTNDPRPPNRSNSVLVALSFAIDSALSNVPELPGKTLVALDTSGSMMSAAVNKAPDGARRGGEQSEVFASEIGALFASALIKRCGADLIVFSDHAKYVSLNPADSLLTMSQRIPFASGGTNFHSIFQSACHAYDRIVILSDMQGWVGYHTPREAFREYCIRYQQQPHLYSWNLCSYGDAQFPEEKIYALAGFSDKAFDLMRLLEGDKQALINKIKAIEWETVKEAESRE
jgi:60 kDa SS-A/Ro ribonucleoprotein